jgi:hypothetical protein
MVKKLIGENLRRSGVDPACSSPFPCSAAPAHTDRVIPPSTLRFWPVM